MNAAVEATLGKLRLYDPLARANHRLRKPALVERHRQLIAFYKRLLKPSSLVFDIGANDGRLTRIFRQLGTQVVAVEPNPTLAAALGRRYRVTVEAVALSDREGEADLHLATADVLSTLNTDWVEITRREGIPTEWTGETMRVPVTTLDRLIERHGLPGYVKIDVEGFEPYVLRGLSAPVSLVSFEYQVANPQGASECVRRLQQLGSYEFCHTVLDENVFREGWSPADRVEQWVEETRGEHGVTASGNVFARVA